MSTKQEFWAAPKSSKILLLSGLLFIIVFPFYGLIKLGTSTTAIAFILLFSLAPGLYLMSCGRKIKTNPILVVTDSEITIQAPFNKSKTVLFSEIKSIENDINQGLVLKGAGRFNSSRIPAKMLSLDDREKLITLLNSSIKSF
ncbi:hypothetical protein [Pseudomonas pohangensis]|uniref:hypothetical protein n=1 Tax=Pseudomonas pohangensis TaxID=364197 RepID=UPI0012FE799E|nr:hypothetical protein [Pseudomonas pohangensis]